MFEKIIRLANEEAIRESKQLLSILNLNPFQSSFFLNSNELNKAGPNLSEALRKNLNSAFLAHQQAIEFARKESWQDAVVLFQQALCFYQEYISLEEAKNDSVPYNNKPEIYYIVIRNCILIQLNFSITSKLLGNKENTIECFHKALKMHTDLINGSNAATYIALGYAAAEIAYEHAPDKNKTEAIKFYLEAQKFYQHAKDALNNTTLLNKEEQSLCLGFTASKKSSLENELGLLHNKLAKKFKASNDYLSAIKSYQEACQFFTMSKDTALTASDANRALDSLGETKIKIGDLYREDLLHEEKDFNNAMNYYSQAVKYYQEALQIQTSKSRKSLLEEEDEEELAQLICDVLTDQGKEAQSVAVRQQQDRHFADALANYMIAIDCFSQAFNMHKHFSASSESFKIILGFAADKSLAINNTTLLVNAHKSEIAANEKGRKALELYEQRPIRNGPFAKLESQFLDLNNELIKTKNELEQARSKIHTLEAELNESRHSKRRRFSTTEKPRSFLSQHHPQEVIVKSETTEEEVTATTTTYST